MGQGILYIQYIFVNDGHSESMGICGVLQACSGVSSTLHVTDAQSKFWLQLMSGCQ